VPEVRTVLLAVLLDVQLLRRNAGVVLDHHHAVRAQLDHDHGGREVYEVRRDHLAESPVTRYLLVMAWFCFSAGLLYAGMAFLLRDARVRGYQAAVDSVRTLPLGFYPPGADSISAWVRGKDYRIVEWADSTLDLEAQ
jgi:hypothetical protein